MGLDAGELVRLDRLAKQGLFAAGLAHEVANLAAGIRLVLRAAQRNGAGDPAEQGLDIVDRMELLLRDFISVGRRASRRPVLVDMNAVTRRALRIAGGRVRAVAQVETDFGDIAAVRSDEVLLGQVVLNLLLNAAQSFAGDNDKDNRISVRSYNSHGEVALEVEDTGCGIPRDDQERVFEPYFTTRSMSEGTGLGLAVCREVVESYGGRIQLRSQPGEGTCFTVWFLAANGAADT